ncbi:MAG: nuclear transport factor 2 family protein, partial [Chthoniobacterales bacterium]
MRIFFCCLLAAAAAGFTARADDCDPAETAQRIIEREKQFLEMGLAQGTRAAFLEFLAEDAIAFEPGPANARQIWKARPEDTISSKWEPLFLGVSRGCDLAFTSGPSEWRKQSNDEKPFGYGQYVTIWKKQNDGAWKIVLDLGSQVPGARKSEEAP